MMPHVPPPLRLARVHHLPAVHVTRMPDNPAERSGGTFLSGDPRASCQAPHSHRTTHRSLVTPSPPYAVLAGHHQGPRLSPLCANGVDVVALGAASGSALHSLHCARNARKSGS